MSTSSLSVSQRITALKSIFADFGISVSPNSNLDLAIQAEFGRGKRSKLTELLNELHQGSDAGKLVACIGEELRKSSNDPQILAISTILQQRLPPLLQIVDVRHSSEKRHELLARLLEHFITKIPANAQTERTLRMLTAAQKNLLANAQIRMAGEITTQVGEFFALDDVKRLGKIMQAFSPALLALDQPDYPIEQKVNHCLHALHILATELHSSKLIKAANILDNIYGLAKVSLPEIAEQATTEQALNGLGISVGTVSSKMLQVKAMQSGLTAKEVAQLIYAGSHSDALSSADHKLLDHTQRNQQYAAICGFLAQLAREANNPQLEKISIAGICIASMRQTYFELKSNNLQAANFSESLGTILLGLGTITHNDTLLHIGHSIVTGVATYAGLAAAPGGALIAVPLAVCSVLGKLFLDPPKEANNAANHLNDTLANILQNILLLQRQMRVEFATLFQELDAQHGEVLAAIDHGYSNLANLMRFNNAKILGSIHAFDQKLQDIYAKMSAEFAGLYLEYVREPLEEVEYVTRYGAQSIERVQDSKHKLALWLLYKSKHPKVNCTSVGTEDLANLNGKLQQGEACLALLNKFVNKDFIQDLPEDLPHFPTWLQAAHAYAVISANDQDIHAVANEDKFLRDVLAIGNDAISFVERLAQNKPLWQSFVLAMQQLETQIQAHIALLQLQIQPEYLQSLGSVLSKSAFKSELHAHAGPIAMQLEPFTPIDVDISDLWQQHLQQHLPEEFFAAVTQGLGSWQIEYCVDKTNSFTDVHIPYGNSLLPDHVRKVSFCINIYFKPHSEQDAHLLLKAKFAYDLRDAKQRFEEYYMRKFKYGLRHTNYHWISLDGLSNQVAGHGNTSTQKLIDYDRLAAVYADWLRRSTLVNVQVMHEPMALLRLQLYSQLRAQMQQERAAFAAVLQLDPVLNALLQKLDIYQTVLEIYMQILNMPYVHIKKIYKFHELLNMLQQPEALNEDLAQKFTELFTPSVISIDPGTEYEQGEFYTKVQAAIAHLGLLQANFVVQRSLHVI